MKTNKIQSFSPCCKRVAGAVLFFACMLLFVSPAGLTAQEKPNPELEKVFRQMQTVQKNFQSFSAKITEKKYTAILKEFGETETGDFFVVRGKDGLMVRQEITSPGRTILTIKGDLLTIYRPSIKQAQIAKLSKSQKNKAEFLSFGLGQSPEDLKKNFEVTYRGEESINGAACSILALKPRDPKVGSAYASIVMWIKKSSGIPIQNKLQERNNDYLLVTFSDEKLNPKISDSKFEQKLPKDVEQMRF